MNVKDVTVKTAGKTINMRGRKYSPSSPLKNEIKCVNPTSRFRENATTKMLPKLRKSDIPPTSVTGNVLAMTRKKIMLKVVCKKKARETIETVLNELIRKVHPVVRILSDSFRCSEIILMSSSFKLLYTGRLIP